MSDVATKELPGNWVQGQIKDLVTIRNGYAFKSKDFKDDGGVPVIRQTNLSSRVVNFNKPKYLPIEFLNEFKSYKINKGDVLIGLSGSIGNLSRYLLDEPALQNQRTGLLVEHVPCSIKYVEYYLQLIKEQLLDAAKGVAVQNISSKTIESWNIPIAPPEQQKRIVAKIEELFSHIDAGIEALKKAKQLLKQYRQSVLKAAVTGELTKEWREANKAKLEPASQLLERIIAERENDYSRKIDEWEKELEGWKVAGEKGKKPARTQKIKAIEDISDSTISSLWKIPESWCWIKLGNLAVDVFDGPFGSNLKSKDYVEEGVRVIRLENIGSLEFKDEKVTYITEKKYETLKKHTVSTGDIIFSSFVADGTRVVVLPQNIEKAINKADCFCIRAFGDSINADYLAHFLSITSTYKRLENQVHGATRPRINSTQLKDLEVPFCSDIEQKEIVRLTREKFEAISRLETEIDHQLIKTEKNKQSVLASAFSGNLKG